MNLRHSSKVKNSSVVVNLKPDAANVVHANSCLLTIVNKQLPCLPCGIQQLATAREQCIIKYIYCCKLETKGRVVAFMVLDDVDNDTAY